MARAGDELVNPATGLRTVFRRTAAETDGELLQVDWIAAPGWTTGPHPPPSGRALRGGLGPAGTARGRVEGTHEAGEVIEAAAGAPHAAWNAGEGEVHVLVDFRPALRTEIAFEALAGLARDGKTTKAGIPKNPLQGAMIVREFEDEIYFVRPPLALQKLIFGPLAGLGRLLGYRPDYRYRRDRD